MPEQDDGVPVQTDGAARICGKLAQGASAGEWIGHGCSPENEARHLESSGDWLQSEV
jgi:hypothetical protein